MYGPYIKKHVTVSRYYCTLTPPVVVDFEPHPRQGKFFLEEKRQYFTERGIVYVPIYLADRLTKAQFADRVKECRALTERAARVTKEDTALQHVQPSGELALSEGDKGCIDHEALRRLEGETQRNTHLRGASRAKRLVRIKEAVMDDWADPTKRSAIRQAVHDWMPDRVVVTLR